MSGPSTATRDFEATRLDVLESLALVEDKILDATPHGVAQMQACRNALSLIYAAQAELRKAAPLPTGNHNHCGVRRIRDES